MNQIDTREIGENQKIVTSWKPGEWNVLEGWRSQPGAQIKIEESLPFGHLELTVDRIQGSLSRMAGCKTGWKRRQGDGVHLREAGHSEIVLKMGTTDTCLNTVGRDQEGRERKAARQRGRKDGAWE